MNKPTCHAKAVTEKNGRQRYPGRGPDSGTG
jgi:hypothetical protein